MEYRILNETAVTCLHQAFLQAFADYQVPLTLSLEDFEKHLKRNGYDGSFSIGVFDDEKLVGFVLNGVRNWQGEKTIYDLGTGVLPVYRKRGLTGHMLTRLTQRCQENGIVRYQLEVIQENQAALSVYQKQGFHITRSLACYQAEKKMPEDQGWPVVQTAQLTAEQWRYVQSFWDYLPSWQNTCEAIMALPKHFTYGLVYDREKWIGYGIVNCQSGDVVQLAVNPHYRKLGVARSLFSKMQKWSGQQRLKLLNVDEEDTALATCLHQLGFSIFVRQYEMEKIL